MPLKPLPMVFAAAAGALMAVQGALNSLLSKSVGLPRASLLVQGLGTAAAALMLLVPWRDGGSFGQLGAAPWYAWLGGPIGVGIIAGVAASMRQVGAGLATTAIIVAQLLSAYLIDYWGLFGMEHLPFGIWKIVGITLVAAGGWLLLR